LFDRFKNFDFGLKKTRDAWVGRVQDIFDRATIDQDLWDDLEAMLIAADVGARTSQEILTRLQDRVAKERLRDPAQVRDALKDEIAYIVSMVDEVPEAQPLVILVIGVNGVGKTTSIAKLANRYRAEGKRVVLAAGDTFRAAAIDQLKVWGQRAGVDVIAHQPGADPGAVVFDAMEAGKNRHADVVIIDTAGRLHTKDHLMEELAKITRIIQRADESAPHEVLLVMDATTGQNGLQQARIFTENAGVTGIVLTKLDGTSRGGVVIAISNELDLPIRWVGTGETIDDFAEFDPDAFAAALFERPAA
jgi:fused signal recognition particle receptor